MTVTTETTRRWNPAAARIQIAQDLTAIEDTYARLRAEAYHHAGDKEIPGGTAMVMLGPRADVEAWTYVQLSASAGRLDTYVGGHWSTRHQRAVEVQEIERDDIDPPLSFIGGWVDIIREQRGQAPSSDRATLEHEVKYLRDALDWILASDEDGLPWFTGAQLFVDQLHHVRYALEEVLREGERDDTGAPCLGVECGGVRLVKQWAGTQAKPLPAKFDTWKCPRCRRSYTVDEYALACKQASRAHADRLSASDMLEQYRVEPATLRKWVQRGHVRRRGKDDSGRPLYDVADTLKQRDNHQQP